MIKYIEANLFREIVTKPGIKKWVLIEFIMNFKSGLSISCHKTTRIMTPLARSFELWLNPFTI